MPVRPLQLDVVDHGGRLALEISAEIMSDVAEAMWLDLTAPPGTLPSLQKKCPKNRLHRDSRSIILFQVGVVAEAGVGTVLPTTHYSCAVPGCDVTLLDPNHATSHSSYHMVNTPSALGMQRAALFASDRQATAPRSF